MRSPHQRIQKDLAALDEAEDPLARLDAGRRLREHAEALEEDLVTRARAAGVSWAKIGRLYGMSKQGAQQRFRAPEPSAPPAANRSETSVAAAAAAASAAEAAPAASLPADRRAGVT